MELDYNVFVNKTKIMLKTIKEEYEIIIQNYSEDLLNNKFNKTTLKARYVETIYSLITR